MRQQRRRPTFQYLWSLILLSALIHLSFNYRWLWGLRQQQQQQQQQRFKSPDDYYFRGEQDALISYSSSSSSSSSSRSMNAESVVDPTVLHNNNTSSRRLCTGQQIRQGRWERVWLDKAPYITKTTHLRCHNLSYYQQRPYPSWEWTVDDDCVFAKWKKSDFCRVFRNQTISIIGDSLSWEHYSSLLQLLQQRVHQTDQHKSRDQKQNHVQTACSSSTTKIVWRNDPRLEYIADSIQADFPQILILNRGAHFVNDTTLLADLHQRIITDLLAWQSKCRQHYSKCHLFWRTSVPGHPHCHNETQPNNHLEEMEDRIQNHSNYNNVSIHYHWYDFQHQNELILQALLESNNLDDFHVLDAYDLNVLRPDDHRAHQNDCLHNCYPGKMDVYNRLLLHYLKMT